MGIRQCNGSIPPVQTLGQSCRAGPEANSPVPLGIHPREVTAESGLGTTKRDGEEGSEAKRCEELQRGREHPIAWGL